MLQTFVKTMAVALAMFATAAMANDIHPNADAKAILAQQTAIRAEVEQGKGRYKDLAADKRSTLLARQNEVFKLLDGKAAVTDLPERDQVAVFNALETIEAIINKAEDDRMVCERVRPTGSNRVQSLCLTVAERRARREAAEKDLATRNAACMKNASGACI